MLLEVTANWVLKLEHTLRQRCPISLEVKVPFYSRSHLAVIRCKGVARSSLANSLLVRASRSIMVIKSDLTLANDLHVVSETRKT